MADAGGKGGGGQAGDHSSGEYSGIVEQASFAMIGKVKDLAGLISSGKAAQAKRVARPGRVSDNKKEKEKEEEEKEEEESG